VGLGKADTFIASITLNGEKTNFLIVKNEPKTRSKENGGQTTGRLNRSIA